MKNLNFEDFLAYHRGELSEEKRRMLEKELTENKELMDIIKGLKKIEKELGEGKSLEDYFSSKKKELMRRIFS